MNRIRRPVPDASRCTSSFGLDAGHVEHVVRHRRDGRVLAVDGCDTSLARKRLTSLSTPLSKVAENSIRCPARGGGQDAG